MPLYYKRIDSFNYCRNPLTDLYFSKVHNRILTETDEETKKLRHFGTPAIGQNILEMFPKDFYKTCQKFFKIFGQDDFFARFFVVAPYETGVVHMDTYADSYEIRNWALNIPVYNTDQNYQEWGMIDYNKKIYNTSNPMYLWKEEENFVVTESMVLDSPTLVKVSVPHRITNPTSKFRVILSLRSVSNCLTFENISARCS